MNFVVGCLTVRAPWDDVVLLDADFLQEVFRGGGYGGFLV